MKHVEFIQREAERVFGNKIKADHWLNQPLVVAGGNSRLQAAHSEAGYELVKTELERIDHGYAS
ncbi:hypothetical protein D3C87_1439330 [compost metagenome]